MLRRSLSICALRGAGALPAPALARRVAIGGLSTAVAASAAAAASSCFVACEATDNPLLNAPALFPRFADIKAEHVQPAMKARLAEAQTSLEALEADVEAMLARGETPTYEHIADAVERLGELVSGPWGAVGHLKMVKDSDALRAAADAIQPEVVAFSSKMSGSVALYKGWCALRDNKAAWDALSPAQRRAASLEILSGELAGVGLVGEKKARFESIQTELAALSTAFSNALLDATKAYSKVLSEPEQVAGLPASARAMMAASAKSRGLTGAGGAEASAEAGPWVATLDGPCLVAVLTYADDAALREAVYKAFITRASEFGMPKVRNDNGPRIKRILQLRQEKAALLGRASHAEVSLASKMATLEEANALLEDLRAKSLGPAQKEHADLEAFAGRSLDLWDVNYYANKLKEKKYSYDAEVVRQFLPLDSVLQVLLPLPSGAYAPPCRCLYPSPWRAAAGALRRRLAPLRRHRRRGDARRRRRADVGRARAPLRAAEERRPADGVRLPRPVCARGREARRRVDGRGVRALARLRAHGELRAAARGAHGVQPDAAGDQRRRQRDAVADDLRRGRDALPRVRPRGMVRAAALVAPQLAATGSSDGV